MQKRFISIWFRHLRTDWFTRRQPALRGIPFVLAAADHGRMIITAANKPAQQQGIDVGIAVADARAIIHGLQVLDDEPAANIKLLNAVAEWCMRFTPAVAVDLPDSLLLDVTGCTHLWGGEKQYITDIYKRLRQFGYDVRIAIADTLGCAWGVARFGRGSAIVESGGHVAALMDLPAAALRLEQQIVERLEKLGLCLVGSFLSMPRPSLRRRFGQALLDRLDEATGSKEAFIFPVHPLEPYHERLPCMEPITTASGIEFALNRLIETICTRLQQEQKGLRVAIFKGYRIDGKIERIEIGTNRPSCNGRHLFKLFEIKIDTLEPALGIELFTLDALKVEDLTSLQEKLWNTSSGLDNTDLYELLDRIEGKVGANQVHRYVPAEHYWPERSCKPAADINEKLPTPWKPGRPRPLHLLCKPELIEVMAPIPDYPPMMFRYQGKRHKIIKADGPERIEQEWWLQQGQHRDYYCVEDEEGNRYWLFRSGHYDAARSYKWFIHGFFA